MIIIPLKLQKAITKGYRGYNNKKYYVYKRTTTEGKTVWILKKNIKFN